MVLVFYSSSSISLRAQAKAVVFPLPHLATVSDPYAKRVTFKIDCLIVLNNAQAIYCELRAFLRSVD